jgi:gamma-glutamyltranspeptidase/glutathione hydrolase
MGDTAYVTVVDSRRNAVSFISSLFHGFGAGLMVDGTGIILNNRACLFSLDTTHPNCIAPGKRPLHTLCPGLVLLNGKLFMSFGIMGGLMQPQSHVQVLSNVLDYRMNTQVALDAPRFRYLTGKQVAIEPGVSHTVLAELASKEHEIVTRLPLGLSFGGGQIILVDHETGALVSGSDSRKDGCAMAI